MIQKFLSVFLVLMACFFSLSAQTFYVSSPINSLYIPGGSSIYKVTVTSTGLESIKLADCSPGDQYFSIAMNKKSLFWLKNSEIYSADVKDESFENCKVLFPSMAYSNALTLGPDEKLYYSGSFLFATDINTGKTDILGSLNYSSSGDMCFYNNELYMASNGGIVKINRQEPHKSVMHIPLPAYTIFGIVSVSTSLRKNTVYGLASINQNRTDVLEFDMENKKVLRVVGSLPYGVLDAASTVENGSILGIEVEKIDINQDCNAGDKAIIEVITKPSLEDLVYELDGITNTTGKFTGLPKGQYELTITSPSDSYTSTIDVPEYNLIKPAYNWKVKNQLCETPGEITFTTPEENSTYQIRYKGKLLPLNSTISNLEAGKTYYFEIINKNGCKVDELNIAIGKDKCLIRFDKIEVSQQCDVFHRGVLTVLTKAHAAPYTYTLNTGESNGTGVFKNLLPGNYSFKITSDEDEFEATAIVPDYKALQAPFTFSKTNPACAEKGSIRFSTTDNDLFKIKYKDDVFPLDHLFSDLGIGTYHFVIIDQNGCLIDEYNVDLKYEPCPIVIENIETQPECNVLGKGIIKITTPSIPETYFYTLNSTETNSTGVFNMLDPGTYAIEVKASGGAPSAFRTVVVPDYSLSKPNTIVNTKNPACDVAGEITFSIGNRSADYNIRYNGDVYPGDHVFSGLKEGDYNFSILKSDGCLVDELSARLVYEPCPIVIENIETQPECNVLGKGSIKITTPSIPETYFYTLNGTETNSTGVFNMLNPGTYEIEVKASGGAPSAFRTVVVPDYSLTKPVTIIKGKSPVCDAAGELSFSIGNRSADYQIRYNGGIYPGDHVFRGLYEGNYTFSVLNLDGCILDELNVTLEREDCNDIEFPNAFSPNSDGVNDIFQAKEGSRAFNFLIQIYDRRGVIIFSSNKLYEGWNGDYKGQPMPVGTYFWVATFTTQESKKVTKKGSVTLIR